MTVLLLSRFLFILIIIWKTMEADAAMNIQFEIPPGYLKHIPPPKLESQDKLQIWASLNLRNIINLSQSNQMISIEASLNLFWYDNRIKVNIDLLHGKDDHGTYLTLNDDNARAFWTPDLYIDGVRNMRGPKKVKYFTAPISWRLYSSKLAKPAPPTLVRYSSRMNMDLGCKMNFEEFPFDRQNCSIKILSYSMDASDLKLEWLDEKESYFGDNTTKLPDFDFFVELHEDPLVYSYFDRITRQPISARIILDRDWKQYVTFYYLPTMVLFFFGWSLNFVLRHHPKSMLKIILTLIVMKAGMMKEIPTVNYLTFFNVWSFFCIVPVFFMIWQWVTTMTFMNMDMKTQSDRMEKVAMLGVPLIYIGCVVAYWLVIIQLGKVF